MAQLDRSSLRPLFLKITHLNTGEDFVLMPLPSSPIFSSLKRTEVDEYPDD